MNYPTTVLKNARLKLQNIQEKNKQLSYQTLHKSLANLASLLLSAWLSGFDFQQC